MNLKNKPYRLMLVLGLSGLLWQGSALAGLHIHEDAKEDIAICGHKEHDSLEVRDEAAAKNFWCDSKAANTESWVRFKILGFNDFHGQLEPRTLFGRPAGGAAVLASYLEEKTEESENGAFIVHAGDHVGATPPVSALLQDEPSISFLNMLGNAYCDNKLRQEADDEHHRFSQWSNPRCNLVGTLGNHEFDEGVDEMLRLIKGGIHENGPYLDPEYDGAHSPYVIANVVYKNSGKPVLPPYVIKRVRGIPVAFIGAVLKETPTIIFLS